MICRMWRGWTLPKNAAAYEVYLRDELFPRLQQELGPRGYRGYHVLRLDRPDETEFTTLVWFDSLESVKGFAGDDYDEAVFSEKARRLLARIEPRAVHPQLAATSWALPSAP